MIKKLTRRMRCEVQGCHKVAVVGLGIRGNDYPLCKDHFKQLADEAKPLYDEMFSNDEKVAVVPEKQPETAPVVEEEPREEEFFVCKYCGEKFSKTTTTAAQFAQHSRKCKKEHAEAESEQ